MYIRWTPTHTDISISFKDSPYSVNENDGSVQVCVLLSVSSTETVTLELGSSAGTATAGRSNLRHFVQFALFYPVILVTVVLSGYHGYHCFIRLSWLTTQEATTMPVPYRQLSPFHLDQRSSASTWKSSTMMSTNRARRSPSP